MNLLNNTISLGAVSLRVKNIANTKAFYKNVIGLDILEETTKSAVLGTGSKALVRLYEANDVRLPSVPYSGLYHLALLLPSENDLTAFLFHASKNEFALDGASDHGFSQAIYLHDNEGNGIEIYVDRPQNQWPYLEDGSIKGMSEALDIDKLVASYDGEPWQGIPESTIMGHVHLQVKDIGTAKKFYEDFLGMERQTSLPSAIFVSKGGYHHHLGINSWARNSQGALPETTTGLLHYEIIVSNYEAIKMSLSIQSDYEWKETDTGLSVIDADGIATVFIKEQK